ncbi:heme lyase NrfEFG subunit NrfF [Parashewanella curva]|uniref:Formate-dependent nitrite reductase complex subunit n=1 Tax=Parashewanella curva TaxID=2338552 RepID=A0A3L8Q029_9GAMM|nr:heme lyase NrfEFG subunit NrfF [Parashewanella curva]RLV60770.1 heme lyase NrfEFG subunit NrfF [Parashewanella curva]
MALLLCVGTFLTGQAIATPVDTYQFKNQANQERGLKLARSMRCPQCQNQDLVDSNSPVAHDLRIQVFKMVDEGKSDEQIVQYMTQRYGDFVLYKPRMDPKTYILWWGPLGLLICGVIVIGLLVRKQRANKTTSEAFTESDEEALKAILKSDDNK